MVNSDKTISIKRTTLTSLSLPTLPFDLIPEILSRLPVKSLLQFRCVCKSWKSLISDPKFANKHLTLSTTHTIHCISYRDNVHVLLKSYSLDSVLTNITETQFPSSNGKVFLVGSCNGMLFLAAKDLLVFQLWNPSIRKFKELPPPIIEPQQFPLMYGFGYDPISDKYKVMVMFCFGHLFHDGWIVEVMKLQVKVHTLGTDSWKNVLDFPFVFASAQGGQYASGSINWLLFKGTKRFIASFDLGIECYREVLLPDDSGKVDKNKLSLSVLRDCLCMISGEDVWVMKEYGNKESWTKLFTISYMLDPRASSYSYIRAECVLDEQVLLTYEEDKRRQHISYDYKNDTSKFFEFENVPKVCVESLISPCF
ncbi:F-box/kelch-repeat protein [Trifolium pratense]|uniref:F-box/kelch-repeat protein n=1 Tax=Trifolium pratense TaxID=57577 RepID=A0A2K3PJU7_TRIPR|nr:F-box/kelch-repeat protein [Trifolium pratense]